MQKLDRGSDVEDELSNKDYDELKSWLILRHEKITGNDRGPLMDQLVKGVLPICPRLTPDDRLTCVDWTVAHPGTRRAGVDALDGRIAEIGTDVGAGRDQIDADGLALAPGIVDIGVK